MGNEILDNDTIRPLGNAQVTLPKDTSTLVMGIIALPFSLGLIGIILSILTLVQASSALALYRANPSGYLESSVKKVRAGRTCAIVSLSLFGAGILVIIAVIAVNG